MLPLSVENSYIEQHRLSLKLTPLATGELYLASQLKHHVYCYQNGLFKIVFEKNSNVSTDQINQMIKDGLKEVYVHEEDKISIKKSLNLALIQVTRSLSIGDPIKKGKQQLKLLSLNLATLYQNPHDDEQLMSQFQSIQNLGHFFSENRKHQSQIFKNFTQEKFHFTLKQPLLSSLLLHSFIESIHLFSDREVEGLFSTSYFKDIGFSLITSEHYDKKDLTEKERDLFNNHANFSFDLLEGRVPLSKNHFSIIKNHHFLNHKMKKIISPDACEEEPEMIYGLETMLIAVFDMYVAMTSERPYKGPISSFQSLEIIKKVMADEYPQEFKALVIFLKQFFKT